MGWSRTPLGYHILRRIAPAGKRSRKSRLYHGAEKVEALLGADVWEAIRGQVVIDFGCGEGHEAIALAAHGAAAVIGIDLLDDALEVGRDMARSLGLDAKVTFAHDTDVRADIIVSIDAFEHFADPAGILARMRALLRPGGRVLVSFGPPWRHPYGGHSFSVFPFSHLLFSERALVRWRSDFKDDGATRLCEVTGGLNRMTVGRFQRIVRGSGMEVEKLEPVPIRRLRRIAGPLTREFTTSIVRARLRKPVSQSDSRPVVR